MLQVIKSIHALDFSQLMYVYAESNGMNGMERYPNLSRNQQLIQAEQDFYAYLRSFFRGNDSFYAVWAPDGRYVSALRIEPYRDGLLLEGLETAPKLRGKGYATALVKQVQLYLENRGEIPIYSHVHKKNLSSLQVHEKCGFERILEYAVLVDGSVLPDICTLRYKKAP